MVTFFIGQKFSSFREFRKALKQYRDETHCEFYSRDGRKLKRFEYKKINRSLRYNRKKLACIFGGREFYSRSFFIRNSKSIKAGCEAFILLRPTKCGSFLEITNLNLTHNHELVPPPITRKEYRAERRRKRLKETLKISYEEAYRMEREEYFRNHPDEILKKKVYKNKLYKSTSEEETEEESEEKTEDEAEEENYNLSSDGNSNSDNIISLRIPIPQIKRIYTRNGDSGMTFTFNGQEKSKADDIFEALGTTEELSSCIGFAIEFLPWSCQNIRQQLRRIQSVLQDLIVHLGTPCCKDSNIEEERFEFPDYHITHVDEWNDFFTTNIPVVDKLILLPSGGKGSCALHVAQSVCRRAERSVCLIKDYGISKNAQKYLNRLGEYLYTIARRMSLMTLSDEKYYHTLPFSPNEFKTVYYSHLKC